MAAAAGTGEETHVDPSLSGPSVDVGTSQNGVEMDDLQRRIDEIGGSQQQQHQTTIPSTGAATTSTTTPNTSSQTHDTSIPVSTTTAPQPTTLAPSQSSIDPSSDPLSLDGAADNAEGIVSAPIEETQTSSSTPVVDIVILPMNGNRYPYKVSAKYLRSRKVDVENMDPFNISVYTLKELISRDWREDWESKPTNPGSIRLINMGRVLEDKQLLKDCRFNAAFPTVLHMSVKPPQDADEEDGKTGKAGARIDRDSGERTAGCRCVIL